MLDPHTPADVREKLDPEQTQVRKLPEKPAAAPRAQEPCLIILGGRNIGKLFKLGGGSDVLGRSDEASIRVDDDGVSRRHARLTRGPNGRVEIEDLRSTNGTYCNGARVTGPRLLEEGDKIQIGNATVLKFSYQDDIEEAFQAQLYDRATRDELTRIPNRKFLFDRLAEDMAYGQRHGAPVTLMMLDVDHFKAVNDTFGHQAGDYVLARLSSVIASTVRSEDLFARYGGEEFVLVLRECPAEKGMVMAERIRRLVETTRFSFNGHAIGVTISIGVAYCTGRQCPSADRLIAQADRFLYEAKQRGRNRVVGQP